MTAIGEVHAHDGVARLGKHAGGRVVCLRTGMRLHVGKLCAKQLLCPVARDVLYHVHGPAATVVAPAGKALGIFVRKGRSHGLHNGQTYEVLGSNELDGVALTRELVADGRRKLRIGEERKFHGSPFGMVFLPTVVYTP